MITKLLTLNWDENRNSSNSGFYREPNFFGIPNAGASPALCTKAVRFLLDGVSPLPIDIRVSASKTNPKKKGWMKVQVISPLHYGEVAVKGTSFTLAGGATQLLREEGFSDIGCFWLRIDSQ